MQSGRTFFTPSVRKERKIFRNHLLSYKRELLRETKKLFPTICQSASAVIMARVISYVRRQIEVKDLETKIPLSVHDSIDCYVPDNEIDTMSKILEVSMAEKTFISLTGDLDEPATRYK